MSKAEELVWKYYHRLEHTLNENYSPHAWGIAKDYALIAVDEIINNNSKIPGLLTQDTMHNTWYWQEVKQEIEKL